MGKVWLPVDSDFALAMREPNLLLPSAKLYGALRSDTHVFGHRVLLRVHFTDASLVELVTGRPVVLAGSARMHGATVGMMYTGSTDSDYVDVRLASPMPSSYTLLAKIKTEGRPSANDNSSLFCFGDDVGGSRSLIYESLNQLLVFNGSSNVFQSTTGFSVSGDLPIGEVRDIAVVNYGTNAEVYVSGVGLADTQASSDSIETTATRLRLGAYFQSGWAADISVEWLIAVEGLLSVAEIQLFRANPKIGLRSANDAPFLISVPAGGGAPTLSSPGAINVLSDRATPQVTLAF